MSIRIVLENPPEFYTNLDIVRGVVILNLSRPENVGAIVVKLEGESRTSLIAPYDNPSHNRDRGHGDTLLENHKILYKVGQVFPDESSRAPGPYLLNPGQHRFPFQFKLPFNNICGNPDAMARIGGILSPSGSLGLGFRVMDGSRQLLYRHVTKTLPPSFTGFPGQAEIRYYLKVTVQRPSLFRENWRYQMGFKFLPIEPPRPAKTNQEAYARRPFAFHPRPQPSAVPQQQQRQQRQPKKRSGFLDMLSPSQPPTMPPRPEEPPIPPPSVEISARLPHPAILTCHKPIPLRLIAKKLAPVQAEVYLIALQVDLIGKTVVRCHNLVNTEVTRWVITSRTGLNVLVSRPDDAVGTDFVVPDSLWSGFALPNTVMPSFVTCNLRRDYELELKLGLAWQLPGTSPQPSNSSSFFSSRNRVQPAPLRQELHLPLHFSSVQVFSGLTPPAALVEATLQGRRPASDANQRPSAPTSTPQRPPDLPPRPSPQPSAATAAPPAAATATTTTATTSSRPSFPDEPPYDDAPPTYEEAMAEMMTGPVFPPTGEGRPAYSGVTDENGPSSLPEGRGVGGAGAGSSSSSSSRQNGAANASGSRKR
ncbi:hypothetical protein VTJ83DRAFT_4038 [Remersonia thermophila]|uniref:Arrestin-like N-terminal domain-containing protein n=1 Tax=Remersonia thermophila TaxID=72144 RepID=A0ABR4DHX4_9PEZI